ncbi:MAG TPA: hypothetical protein VFU65_01440 [Actinocrinis sp.]|nr:hypothetical protein [Actinocrinis sp.]
MAWLVAGVLFLLGGLAEAAALFARTLGGSTNQHVYESLGLLVGQCVKAVILLACGVLIMNRRTRDTACGLALGVVLIVDTNSFWRLRPSRLSSEYDALGISVSLANFALQAAGAIVVLVLVIRQRTRRTGHTRRTRRGAPQRRADRVAAVLLGFGGAVLLTISNLLTSYRLTLGTIFGGPQRSQECCSWAQNDGWNHVAVVLGGTAMIALALLAATVRAKARAAGLLFGMALVSIPDVALTFASSVAPKQTFLGFHYRQFVGSDITLSFTPTAGFWIELVGMLLIAGAGICRLLLGPREDRYLVPELTGAR